MRRRTLRLRAALLSVALAIATVSGCGVARSCPACGRDECGNLTFTIRATDGRSVETCCARCGLNQIRTEALKVASLAVRDFDAATEMDAERAFYVEGSDVAPCASMSAAGGPPKDERGCCLKPVFDRCLPSLLAFRSRERAEDFARGHGGEVRTFAEIRSASESAAVVAGG